MLTTTSAPALSFERIGAALPQKFFLATKKQKKLKWVLLFFELLCFFVSKIKPERSYFRVLVFGKN